MVYVVREPFRSKVNCRLLHSWLYTWSRPPSPLYRNTLFLSKRKLCFPRCVWEKRVMRLLVLRRGRAQHTAVHGMRPRSSAPVPHRAVQGRRQARSRCEGGVGRTGHFSHSLVPATEGERKPKDRVPSMCSNRTSAGALNVQHVANTHCCVRTTTLMLNEACHGRGHVTGQIEDV